MANRSTIDDRLDGWEAISNYLGWTPRTVIRWEKQKGLPVHRVGGGKRQPIYAYRHEIDEWFQKTGSADTGAISGPLKVKSKASSKPLSGVIPTWRTSPLHIHAAVAAIILLVAALGTAWRLSSQPAIQITDVMQLTDDGTAKENLVTDGRQLYFNEDIGDNQVLSTVPVSGGQIRQISLPLANPRPEDISSDGRLLLVLSDDDHEEEHRLWLVPTTGGAPHQIAGIKCQTAAWSPNGEWIAVGSGSAIYAISMDGYRRHELIRLDGNPEAIRWSLDGKHLVFFLQSSPTGATSLWQVSLDPSINAERSTLVQIADKDFRQDQSLARTADRYFSVTNSPTTDFLWAYRPRSWSHARSFEATALNTRFESIQGLAADGDHRRLFVLSSEHQRGELDRYDLSTHSFTMMLPGASATYVDLARDINSVAYVKTQDYSLWTGRIDGAGVRELSPEGMAVELPRWSPDARRIAFMGKQPNQPWRIFVVPADGGTPKEASRSNDNQGAPTWSPDGQFLVYGDVLCQADHPCAIHKIDLASGKATTLPGSEGLGTARWSPDGRHIAALNPAEHELCVLDLDRQKWRTLAEGINGNDVSWSSDSRFVYTKSSMSGQAKILRVAVGGGTVQTILNLRSFSKSAGQLDTWFALTPDNALILNRWLNTSEVYALSYR